MISLIKRLLQIRIVRYGLVGGIGIPINDLALYIFTTLFSVIIPPSSFLLFVIASACAFEVSNIINFVLNQFFTYSEQSQHIHGWEWLRRLAKGQLTSLSANLISYLIALTLVYFLHISGYLANPAGIIFAFFYNFFISNKLVFRPTMPAPTPTAAVEVEIETKIGITPK